MSHAHGSLIGKLLGVRKILMEAVQRGMFRQAVLSVRRGEESLDFSIVDGMESPLKANRLFDVASMTKTIIAIMVQILIKLGIIKMETTIREIFEGSGRAISEGVGEITIGELKVHSVYFETPTPLGQLSGDAIIEALLQSKAHRGYFKYTNLCYVLLGAALETQTGKSLHDLSRRMFLGPVCDLGFYWDKRVPQQLLRSVVPTSIQAPPPGSALVCNDPVTQRMHLGKFLSGAAGVFSTASALAGLFKEAFGGSTLLDDAAKGMLLENGVGDLPRWGETTPSSPRPVFAKFGVNYEMRGDRVVNLFSGFTACHGCWIPHMGMSAALLTDGVVYGEGNRAAVQPLFRGEVLDLLMMA